MRIAALILGLLGGIVGVIIGIGYYSLYSAAAALGVGVVATLYQIGSIAAPVASLIGGGLALSRPGTAAILMTIGAVGMIADFNGFTDFTAVPIVTSAIGAVLAAVSARSPR